MPSGHGDPRFSRFLGREVGQLAIRLGSPAASLSEIVRNARTPDPDDVMSDLVERFRGPHAYRSGEVGSHVHATDLRPLASSPKSADQSITCSPIWLVWSDALSNDNLLGAIRVWVARCSYGQFEPTKLQSVDCLALARCRCSDIQPAQKSARSRDRIEDGTDNDTAANKPCALATVAHPLRT